MTYDAGSVVFSDWEIVRKIGSGASGTVFEAQKEVTGSVMRSAVKVITIPTSDSDADVLEEEGMDEESTSGYFYGFVKELSAEIAMMGKLQGHPNIVSYEDHAIIPHEGRIGWDILIRMELLTSLPVWMKTHTMGEEDVVQLAKNLCSALAVCEEIGIIHRDIKPANVFVSEVGSFRQFKLGDFGVARIIEKTTGGLSKKGTERYMAPEVYKGEEYGKTVDIYSLGLMLYSFMNYNRLPFYPPYPETITYESRTQALVRRMRGEKMPAPDDASPEFAKIILRACAYEPGQRYQSAQEMLNDLGQLNSSASREEDRTVSFYSAAEDKIPSGNSTALNGGGYTAPDSGSGMDAREDENGETLGVFASENLSVNREENREKANVLFHKAITLYFQKKYRDALQLLNEALTLDSQNFAIFLWIGHCYDDTGATDKAIEYYRQAIRINPKEPWPYESIGAIYINRREYAKAKGWYEKAVQYGDGSSNDYWRIIAHYAIPIARTGDPIRAEGLIKEAELHGYKYVNEARELAGIPANDAAGSEGESKTKKEKATSLLNKAVTLHDQGKYQDALQLLNEALTLDSQNSSTLYLIGHCYGKMGYADNAIEYYKRAIRVNPKEEDAVTDNNIGVAYTVLGNYAEAREWLKRAVQYSYALDRNSSTYWQIIVNYAIALARTGDPKRAEGMIKEAETHGYKNGKEAREKAGIKNSTFNSIFKALFSG